MYNVIVKEMIYKIQVLLKCVWNGKGNEILNKKYNLLIIVLRKMFVVRNGGGVGGVGVVFRCYVFVLCNYL